MHIREIPEMTGFVFDRLVSFEADFVGKDWEELYHAVQHLKAAYPQERFSRAPHVYVDLSAGTSGFIFVANVTEKLFYVYR